MDMLRVVFVWFEMKGLLNLLDNDAFWFLAGILKRMLSLCGVDYAFQFPAQLKVEVKSSQNYVL